MQYYLGTISFFENLKIGIKYYHHFWRIDNKRFILLLSIISYKTNIIFTTTVL